MTCIQTSEVHLLHIHGLAEDDEEEELDDEMKGIQTCEVHILAEDE